MKWEWKVVQQMEVTTPQIRKSLKVKQKEMEKYKWSDKT